ncbi:MAG: hypothetical protein IJ565_03435 [Bacilli bacterium]|nr:hypothetical protein [Bacilli bacterium]
MFYEFEKDYKKSINNREIRTECNRQLVKVLENYNINTKEAISLMIDHYRQYTSSRLNINVWSTFVTIFFALLAIFVSVNKGVDGLSICDILKLSALYTVIAYMSYIPFFIKSPLYKDLEKRLIEIYINYDKYFKTKK